MPTTRKRAFIYCRISQDRDGATTSVDRQERDCRALAKREGLRVVRVFTDRDTSAYSGRARPEFDEMMRSLDGADALIFLKTDRLVRRLSSFHRVLDACATANVRLLSVHDQIDTTSPIGQAVAGVIAALGEEESAGIGRRVRSKQEENAVNGRRHGGRRAYGFSLTGDIVEEEAAVLREARDRVFAGESLRTICLDFERRGIVATGSKNTPARPFRTTHLRTSLLGAPAAGLRQFRGEVTSTTLKDADGHDLPAIISPDDRERLCVILETGRTPRGPRGKYLCTGLLRCGKCQATLGRAVVDPKRGGVWRCSTDPGVGACGKLSIKADPVDEVIEALIVDVLSSAKFRRCRDAEARRWSRPIGTTGATIAELEARITALGVDLDDGEISRAEWSTRRSRLVAKLEEARAAILPDVADRSLEGLPDRNVQEWWDQRSLDQQRAIARRVLDYVEIRPAEVRGGRVFNPDRIDPHWSV
jgi:DNA invertase Pin-like site-specific DNA recombinase